jgi:polyphosphate kinase 2 (PPK2 family)
MSSSTSGRCSPPSGSSRGWILSDYERRLSKFQETLQRVQQAYLVTPHRVLEGWDTAGQGGVVRRLGWALDPRSFKVAAAAAPGGRAKSRHCLRRSLGAAVGDEFSLDSKFLQIIRIYGSLLP